MVCTQLVGSVAQSLKTCPPWRNVAHPSVVDGYGVSWSSVEDVEVSKCRGVGELLKALKQHTVFLYSGV